MTKKLSAKILITLTVLAAITILLFYNTKAAMGQGVDQIISSEPKPVPYVTFLDQNSLEHTLDEYRGKVVIINFWALWCAPCKEEMPALDKLQKELGGIGLQVLPLSNDYNGIEGANKFYEDNNINYLPIFIDEKSKAFRTFRLKGLPTSIIIDRRGMEAARVTGFIDWSNPEVVDYINKLLKEPV